MGGSPQNSSLVLLHLQFCFFRARLLACPERSRRVPQTLQNKGRALAPVGSVGLDSPVVLPFSAASKAVPFQDKIFPYLEMQLSWSPEPRFWGPGLAIAASKPSLQRPGGVPTRNSTFAAGCYPPPETCHAGSPWEQPLLHGISFIRRKIVEGGFHGKDG